VVHTGVGVRELVPVPQQRGPDLFRVPGRGVGSRARVAGAHGHVARLRPGRRHGCRVDRLERAGRALSQRPIGTFDELDRDRARHRWRSDVGPRRLRIEGHRHLRRREPVLLGSRGEHLPRAQPAGSTFRSPVRDSGRPGRRVDQRQHHDVARSTRQPDHHDEPADRGGPRGVLADGRIGCADAG